MGKRKHKFIDKKKAVTFRLVNRSQQDPLIVDANAPQHVLMPIGATAGPDAQPGPSKSRATPDLAKKRKDQISYGIYYEDDYDYLQHLRDPGRQETFWEEIPAKIKENVSKIQLPSTVFASEFEEDVGMLARQAQRPGPRPDWDPEIVAALDDDFDFEDPNNELDDNFMELAMGGEDECEEGSEEEWSDEEASDVDSNKADNYSDEELDDLGPLPHSNFEHEETKSRFTEYSMSSSVIRRNEQLSLLDDRFEKFFENYDDPELGAVDLEDIEGHVEITDERLLKYANEFCQDEKLQPYQPAGDVCQITKMKERAREDSDEEFVELEVSDDDEENPKKKWDCESILSTYSNIYNHPKLLADPPKKKVNKIEIHPRTGIPVGTLENDKSGKLTMRSLAKLNNEFNDKDAATGGPGSICAESVMSTLSILSIRPKNESSEEKKERKQLLKEYRAERRIEKKANQIAFKQEELRQHQIHINAKKTMGSKIL